MAQLPQTYIWARIKLERGHDEDIDRRRASACAGRMLGARPAQYLRAKDAIGGMHKMSDDVDDDASHEHLDTPDKLIAAGYEAVGYVVDPIGLADYFPCFVVLEGNMCWVKR